MKDFSQGSLLDRKITRGGIAMSFVIAAVVYIFLINLNAAYGLGWGLFPAGLQKYVIAALTLFGAMTFVVKIGRMKWPGLIKAALCLTGFSLFSTVLSISIQREPLDSMIYIIFWCALLVLAYVAARNAKYKGTYSSVLVLSLAVFFAYFMYLSNPAGALQYAISVNSVYYLVCILMFVVCLKSKFFKWGFVVLICALSLMSAKRAGIVALCAALFMWLITNIILSKKRGAKVILVVMAVAAAMIILLANYDTMIENSDISFIQRFRQMDTDKGSGRLDIYLQVLNSYAALPPLNLVFGCGYGGVTLTAASMNAMAHNEFLEILYDYGVVGLGMYIWFWVELIKLYVKTVKARSKLAVPMGVSLGVFFPISLLSILMPYPRYFLYFVIFWAMCMAEFERENERGADTV